MDEKRAALAVGEPVSELDGAMQHLEAAIGEHAEVIATLLHRLEPVLGTERDDGETGETISSVDPRSPHVRRLSEEAERLHDITERARRALTRLDI